MFENKFNGKFYKETYYKFRNDIILVIIGFLWGFMMLLQGAVRINLKRLKLRKAIPKHILEKTKTLPLNYITENYYMGIEKHIRIKDGDNPLNRVFQTEVQPTLVL